MMKMNATENENDNSFVKNDVLRVTQSDNRKQVDFYLINDIEDIHDYIDFLREVRDCRQGDLITVHINCYGGNVDVALNIYDVIVFVLFQFFYKFFHNSCFSRLSHSTN